MKTTTILSIILLAYSTYGQTFKSKASLVQLQIADVKQLKEDTSITTSLEHAFSYNFRDPKAVNLKVEVTDKEIILTSEYPKHSNVTYKVVKANLPKDGKLNYENPIYFECMTESGGNCKISYSLLKDMNVEENNDSLKAERQVFLQIQFTYNRYDYTGYLD